MSESIYSRTVTNAAAQVVEESSMAKPDSTLIADRLRGLQSAYDKQRAELTRLRAEVERLRRVESRFADIYWRQDGVPKDHRLVLGLLDSGWVEIVYRDGGKWLLNEDAPPVNVQAWCPQPMTDEEWEAEQQILSAKPATGDANASNK